MDRTTIILDHNNTIYMGDITEGSLENPLQSEENGIHIEICPKKYYPNDSGFQTVTPPDGTIITIL